MRYISGFGLLGGNISASLSPKLHNYWLDYYKPIFPDNLKQDISYQLIELSELNYNLFLDQYQNRRNADFSSLIGFNVTSPLKSLVYEYGVAMDWEFCDISRRVACVNVLKYHADKNNFSAFNTDYTGFMRSFNSSLETLNVGEIKVVPEILLLGSGAVARTIISALGEKNYPLAIKTSSPQRTELLCIKYPKMKNLQAGITSINQPSTAQKTAFMPNIIINCGTASDLNKYLTASDLTLIKERHGEKVLFFDVNYKNSSDFYNKAIELGFHFTDGLAMLIEQARLSFEIWFNILPEENNLPKDIYNI